MFFCWLYWICYVFFFFFSSRRRHTRCYRDWSSDVCSSDLPERACPSFHLLATGVSHRRLENRLCRPLPAQLTDPGPAASEPGQQAPGRTGVGRQASEFLELSAGLSPG